MELLTFRVLQLPCFSSFLLWPHNLQVFMFSGKSGTRPLLYGLLKNWVWYVGRAVSSVVVRESIYPSLVSQIPSPPPLTSCPVFRGFDETRWAFNRAPVHLWQSCLLRELFGLSGSLTLFPGWQGMLARKELLWCLPDGTFNSLIAKRGCLGKPCHT